VRAVTVLLVAAGGAAGTLARYGIGTLIHGPWPTVAINLAGSFALGVVAGSGGLSPTARTAIGVGVLGGFTTYSTFAVQVVLDAEAGLTGRAAAYLLASVLGGLACAAAGYALARAS
jgi:CrcB protein